MFELCRTLSFQSGMYLLTSSIQHIRKFLLEISEIYKFTKFRTKISVRKLPHYNFSLLNEITYKSQIKLCQIFYKKPKMNQFRMFTGIPFPSHRWVIMKLLHHFKCIRNDQIHLILSVITQLITISITIFQFLNILKEPLNFGFFQKQNQKR